MPYSKLNNKLQLLLLLLTTTDYTKDYFVVMKNL